jgi:RNA polymerase sigma factor (sigma-70 family)
MTELESTTLEELWTEYREEMVRYVNRYVWAVDDQEDVVSTIYLKAAVAIANGNGYRCSVRGWIFTVAKSAIRDYWRSRLHQRENIVDWAELWDDAEPGLPLHEQVGGEIQVSYILSRLTDKQAQAVRLRADGYELEEIADVMNTTYMAVKQLYIRTRAMLRSGYCGLADELKEAHR